MAAFPLFLRKRMRIRFDFIMGKRVRQLYSCNNEIGSSPRFSACIFSLRHLLQLFFRFWQYVISDLVQDHGTYRLFLFMFQGIAVQ